MINTRRLAVEKSVEISKQNRLRDATYLARRLQGIPNDLAREGLGYLPPGLYNLMNKPSVFEKEHNYAR
jgi:hypothetical protein